MGTAMPQNMKTNVTKQTTTLLNTVKCYIYINILLIFLLLMNLPFFSVFIFSISPLSLNFKENLQFLQLMHHQI